jgi:pimeloyl-ACP methyl ester carboxylesterase
MMMIAFWSVGAAIVAMILMLVTVSIARKLDKASQQGDPPRSRRGDALRTVMAQSYIRGKYGVLGGPPSRRLPKQVRVLIAIAAAFIGLLAVVISAATKAESQTPVSEDTEITSGALHGAWRDAGKGSPIVLLVPGSGPTSRDGDSGLGLKTKTYLRIAEGLAAQGVSSVRVDKHGMYTSAGSGNPNAVTVESYASDYRAWIDAIKARTGATCVWLLGHSEGAMMVSAAAAGRNDVCGLLLVSGAGRKLGIVLREQLKANPANAPLLAQAEHAISELEAGRHVDVTGMHAALLPLFAPQVQDFEISTFRIDPVELVKNANVATLVLQGSTDIQTSREDAQLLASAPKAKLVMLDGVNHVLRQAPADRQANIATYANPDLPLAPGVIDAIAGFVKHKS